MFRARRSASWGGTGGSADYSANPEIGLDIATISESNKVPRGLIVNDNAIDAINWYVNNYI
jgi:hypothetical protein